MNTKKLAKLKADGYIRDYQAEPTPERKISKEKVWIEETLTGWCSENNKILVEELKFHAKRKWRFDYAIPELKLCVEYEGIFSKKSRHTTRAGYTGDVEKYNQAQLLGWKVLRYTAKNYKDLIKDLQQL